MRVVRQPHVGVDRDERALAALHVEVGLGELGAAGERGALVAVAADQRLLLAQAGAVPRLDVHVDPAGDEVGAVGQPVGARRRRPRAPRRTSRCSAVSSALRLAVPSLKPSRLRGVACLVDVEEVRPKPSWAQRSATRAEPDPREVADRVHGDLRVVGAGLDAQVAVAAARGRGCRPGSAAARAATAGCRSSRPNRSLPSFSNRRRPEAEGEGQPGRRCRPRASPVSLGGASYGVGQCSRRPSSPAVICRAAAVHSLQQRDQRLARVGGDVEGGEVQPVLRGRGDAGLVRARGTGRPRLADALRRLLVSLPVGAAADAGRTRPRARPPRRLRGAAGG